MKTKVAIIGGGIAGASVALKLSEYEDIDITLFEKESSLVSGPPMCHLHAGGNLYPDITRTERFKLLEQSIELMRFYPHGIDLRPTVIAIPKRIKQEPQQLLREMQLLQKHYETLIEQDKKNSVLGAVKNYFKSYSRSDIEELLKKERPKKPKTPDEWMQIAAAEMELEKLQFPLFVVQEYGLNLFRIAAQAELQLKQLSNTTLRFESEVSALKEEDSLWHLSYKNRGKIYSETFDYIINAAGFRSGIIDDMAGAPQKRLVEFKAAYVTQWQPQQTHYWPEIIFYGERGTPYGMGQFTPYPNGYIQLHGMTQQITLFKEGLVKSQKNSAHAPLPKQLLTKIEKGWQPQEFHQRTEAAIEHIAEFLPAFKSATVAAKPLYGAQQIPGENASLRAAELSFGATNYARCETVKASSVLSMARDIIKDLTQKGLLKNCSRKKNLPPIKREDVDTLAKKIAQEREYPPAMGGVNLPFDEELS